MRFLPVLPLRDPPGWIAHPSPWPPTSSSRSTSQCQLPSVIQLSYLNSASHCTSTRIHCYALLWTAVPFEDGMVIRRRPECCYGILSGHVWPQTSCLGCRWHICSLIVGLSIAWGACKSPVDVSRTPPELPTTTPAILGDREPRAKMNASAWDQTMHSPRPPSRSHAE
ncbi:hypothetical protein BD413DRAFT_582890 [Trametes elegans]|nr:hypothetical protein BD413DRAFT_582890 [Trametes elegans]